MNADSPLYNHYKNELSKSPIFSGLSEQLLDNMLEQFQYTTWRRTNISSSTALMERFHLIINGRVKIEHIDPQSGDQVTLFILGSGDGFDVISLLDGKPRDIRAVAIEDLHLLTAHTQTVREWINHYPEFNINFLPYLGVQMRTMETLAADLATKDTITRLARLILRHTAHNNHHSENNRAKNNHHQIKLIHDLSNTALAQMIGSTRQVVNHHLQALRHKGILINQSKNLAIKELEGLHEIADKFLSRNK